MTVNTETIRLGFALSRDYRDMKKYRYDLAAGVLEWERIRDEAYADFDCWLAEHDRYLVRLVTSTEGSAQ